MTDTDITKITRLEEQMKNLDEKMVEGFDDIKENIKRIETVINAFMEKSDDKFAAKWVENGAKYVVGLVFGAVILALVALIIKK